MKKQNVSEAESQAIKDKNDLLGQAINTALEMELAFKLYSYRIVNADQFLARVNDLCTFFREEAKDETISNLKIAEDE